MYYRTFNDHYEKVINIIRVITYNGVCAIANEWADLLIKNKLATTCTLDKRACCKIVGGLVSSFMIKQNSLALIVSTDDDNMVKMPSTYIKLKKMRLEADIVNAYQWSVNM